MDKLPTDMPAKPNIAWPDNYVADPGCGSWFDFIGFSPDPPCHGVLRFGFSFTEARHHGILVRAAGGNLRKTPLLR